MRARRLLSSFSSSVVVAAVMGCNAIVGTEDISYVDDETGSPEPGNEGGTGSSGNNPGGGNPPDGGRDARADGDADVDGDIHDADPDHFEHEDAPTHDGGGFRD